MIVLQTLFGKEADRLEHSNDDEKTCILFIKKSDTKKTVQFFLGTVDCWQYLFCICQKQFVVNEIMKFIRTFCHHKRAAIYCNRFLINVYKKNTSPIPGFEHWNCPINNWKYYLETKKQITCTFVYADH